MVFSSKIFNKRCLYYFIADSGRVLCYSYSDRSSGHPDISLPTQTPCKIDTKFHCSAGYKRNYLERSDIRQREDQRKGFIKCWNCNVCNKWDCNPRFKATDQSIFCSQLRVPKTHQENRWAPRLRVPSLLHCPACPSCSHISWHCPSVILLPSEEAGVAMSSASCPSRCGKSPAMNCRVPSITPSPID